MKNTSVANGVHRVNFPEHGDARGHLVVFEGGRDVPFDVRRLFYIYGSSPEVVRGQHANRRSEFVLVNIVGSCKVKVFDGVGGCEVFVLDNPREGIYLPPMHWKDMYDFSPDSLLLVLSSEHYDPDEYIREFGQFEAEASCREQ